MSHISPNYEKYMKRCLQIALHGLGNVSPNPMVGCVIVNNDIIIGEGYHKKYGEPHAEVNAIHSVKDKELLKTATLYVNLEPCSHYGKTPPCADLIIKSKIPRVIIATRDCNEKVAGKGIELLKNAGCELKIGLLEKESLYLNRRFFTFHEKKRPYIILKWAETQDGFIDRLRKNSSIKEPNWITSEKIRIIVHKWRTEEDAIMVGTNTALKDNPALTARDWQGKNPVRIVLDRNLTLLPTLKIFDNQANTIIFNTKKTQIRENLKFFKIKFDDLLIENLLKALHKENIQSVIVEGGTQLLNSFIEQNLWDEATVFKGSKSYHQGIEAPRLLKDADRTIKIHQDSISFYNNIN